MLKQAHLIVNAAKVDLWADVWIYLWEFLMIDWIFQWFELNNYQGG